MIPFPWVSGLVLSLTEPNSNASLDMQGLLYWEKQLWRVKAAEDFTPCAVLVPVKKGRVPACSQSKNGSARLTGSPPDSAFHQQVHLPQDGPALAQSAPIMLSQSSARSSTGKWVFHASPVVGSDGEYWATIQARASEKHISVAAKATPVLSVVTNSVTDFAFPPGAQTISLGSAHHMPFTYDLESIPLFAFHLLL